MADISFMQKENLEDSDEAMEAEEGGGASGGGGGDEGGGHMVHLTRLQQHANSDTIFNRQMVGRILVDIFHSAADTETKLPVEEYMKYVYEICDDPEAVVRSDLVEQLPFIAMICQKAPHLFGNVLHDHLLGIIKKYLLDADSQVHQTAQEALLALIKSGLLDAKTIEEEICPIVKNLSHKTLEHLNSEISFMNKMAPLIGKKLTEKVFLDRYIALCSDNVIHIRRICAAHFGEICAAVGRKARFCRLFPIFVQLCCDRVWGVRKACVDVMMPVSCCVRDQHRRILLAEILATHLNDDSKWVRMSAFQILGPFISTFAKQFTKVTYNQHGELVFTSQQDDHFSIRYSYKGIFPTKCALRSQPLDTDDYDFRDVLPNIALSDLDVGGCKEVYENSQTNCSSSVSAQKIKIQKKDVEREQQRRDELDDIDKYNPFLYYYIPPDLPLDDQLVEAAQKSFSISNNNDTSSGNTERGENKSKKETQKNSSSATDEDEEGEEEDAVKKGDVDGSSSSRGKSYRSEENEGNNNENEESGGEDEDDDFSTWSDVLNETVDIMDTSNLSLDRSSFCVNLPQRKKDSKNNKQQQIVPQNLVDYFVSMAEPEQCTEIGGEIPHHCAFSFPAVVLTLGKENWPYLKKAYQSLACAQQWKVRRTLASSIHEIAIILGEELTATDLVPIYDGFIKDLDEVRIGVLKHLATFLKILKPVDRWHYLPRLNDFLATDNEWNWRFREELVTQLLEAVTLFSAKDVAQHIAPLSLQLLIDKVAAVRQVALTLVTRIVSHLSTDEHLVTAFIEELRDALAINLHKWIRRQTYALLCAQLIREGAITGDRFAKEMLPNLLNLSWDKVPNVRLAVARTLAQNVAPMASINWLEVEHAECVKKILLQMRMDPDRDVRILAGGEEHPTVDFHRN